MSYRKKIKDVLVLVVFFFFFLFFCACGWWRQRGCLVSLFIAVFKQNTKVGKYQPLPYAVPQTTELSFDKRASHKGRGRVFYFLPFRSCDWEFYKTFESEQLRSIQRIVQMSREKGVNHEILNFEICQGGSLMKDRTLTIWHVRTSRRVIDISHKLIVSLWRDLFQVQ
jgi:hypothetical protein